MTTIPGVQRRTPSSQTGSGPKAGGWRSQHLHLPPTSLSPPQAEMRETGGLGQSEGGPAVRHSPQARPTGTWTDLTPRVPEFTGEGKPLGPSTSPSGPHPLQLDAWVQTQLCDLQSNECPLSSPDSLLGMQATTAPPSHPRALVGIIPSQLSEGTRQVGVAVPAGCLYLVARDGPRQGGGQCSACQE